MEMEEAGRVALNENPLEESSGDDGILLAQLHG